MLQILYGLASFLETGIGIWAFAQAVPKRRTMKKRHTCSEIVLLSFIILGVYTFPTTFWKFKNENLYAKLIMGLYCIALCALFLNKWIKNRFGKIESNVVILILFYGMVAWIGCQYWTAFLSENAIILGNALPVCYLFAFYECSFLQAYLWEFLYLTNLGLLKGCYIVCIGILDNRRFEEFFYPPRMVTFSETVYLVLIPLLLLIFFRHISVERFMQKILNQYKKSFLLVAVIEFIALDRLMNNGIGEIRDKNFIGTLIAVAAMIVILLILYIRSLNKTIDTEKRLLEVRNETVGQQYSELNEAYEKYRCLVHDEKHMILYLQECIQNENLHEAAAFLNSYQRNFVKEKQCSWTGIPTLDFMLNIKKRKMDELQIRFEIDCKIEDIPMEDADFIVVLGNLFDNAIEATAKCEAPERKIELFMQNVNEMFVLKMKNSSISRPKVKNERFLTDKKEKDKHGWGIESVRHIVDKYNGSVMFQYDADEFEASIIINE